MQSIDMDVRHAAIVPWNKGEILGPKPPLQTKYVWSIRSKLHAETNGEGRLAMLRAILGGVILLSLCACDQAKQEETVAAISGRFMIVSAGSYYNAKDAANVSGVWRLDTSTGALLFCTQDAALYIHCGPTHLPSGF